MREGRLNGHEAHAELSHQQLVLVLTLICCEKKYGMKGEGENKVIRRGERKQTEKY